MEEDNKKIGWKFFLLEIILIGAGAAGMWFLGGIRNLAQDRLLGNCVMTVFMLAAAGLQARREYVHDGFDYDNGEHVCRFLFCTAVGLVIAFVCGFLPTGGWPFLLVYVMLALFSNMGTGIMTATSLLLISVMLSGAAADGLILYFVSGVFAVTLFRHLESEKKIGIPVFLSILCLLVCETANLVLVANARPDFEMFVIPVANMIVSSVLLLGCLKLFFSKVVYRYREIWLEINDTENTVLTELRERDRKEYMHCIHTAHFCESIGGQLGMNADALKCAGYYHRLGDRMEAVMKEKRFPPPVREILFDYRDRKQGMRKKETAVLVCSEKVVSSMTYMREKGEQHQIDYDKVIDTVFRKMRDDGSFEKCNITVRELCAMHRIFKEEKLYYELLC